MLSVEATDKLFEAMLSLGVPKKELFEGAQFLVKSM
uniref:Uncharacterized protein n=1 Tax=Arundo donax TaxID=35708 RepID=A0A0A9F6V4_ARUDO